MATTRARDIGAMALSRVTSFHRVHAISRDRIRRGIFGPAVRSVAFTRSVGLGGSLLGTHHHRTGAARALDLGCGAANGESVFYSEDDLTKSGAEGKATGVPASSESSASSDAPPAASSSGSGAEAADPVEATSGSGGDGHGDGGSGGSGGGGGDDGKGDEGEDKDKDEGLLPLDEAEKVLGKDVTVPEDWQALARLGGGLRQSVLVKYLALINAGGVLSALVAKFPFLRDRLIEDPRFLFKVLTEVLIDSGCATFAEVKKRGDVFWDEFEFYLSDLVVGIFLDVALVTLLAPTCIAGASGLAKAAGVGAGTKGVGKYVAMFTQFQKSLPSAVFEKSIKGLRVYTPQQRAVAFFYKGVEYALVGFACGLVGQSMANTAMIAKRAYTKSKQAGGEAMEGGSDAADGVADVLGSELPAALDEVPVPPLFRTACVWALFMGLSSNTRYQIVFGLERVVEGTVIAKKVPMIANLATIAIRFANNIYGGEQFIDMARWAGIQ